jgi:hypothetical protein
MIVVEEHDDQPRVETVTHKGSRTRANVMEQGIQTNQWVRKEVEPPPTFDPQRERDTYKKSRNELLET